MSACKVVDSGRLILLLFSMSHTGAATRDDRQFAFEILHHAIIQADISR